MIKKGFSYIGIYFLHLLSFLPFWFLYTLSDILYYPIYYLIRYRRQIVRKNLLNAFPDKELAEIIQIEKKHYRYLTDLMFEIVKLSSISKPELLSRVKMKEHEQVQAYLKRGESTISCTGHYGNWEMCMVVAGIEFYADCNVIYKPINNKTFESWFNRLRSRFGNTLVAMRQTPRQVIATKNETTMFCFASDQSPVRSEVQYTLNFLNQSTAVLMGLEKIARQTNRPVFYFEFNRVKRGYYEIVAIPLCLNPKQTKTHEITDLFFKHLEQTINKQPQYWLWSHNRWKLNH
ncbi:lysophospholipid acyltransferase family protein [Pedobacter sp.]|uniref:lysophospholipid acyltransferase family protein n=1 Tax=Pedobacter sp. TaxID=1411316 RepID=UPI00396C7914